MQNLISQLNQLQNNIESLPQGDNVNLSELFTNEFMSKHTVFKSFDEFTDAFNIDQERFDQISESELDLILKENTKFSSWDDFCVAANQSKLFANM